MNCNLLHNHGFQAKDKHYLQGHNISDERREEVQKANMENFEKVFSMSKDDYRKQEIDIANGE